MKVFSTPGRWWCAVILVLVAGVASGVAFYRVNLANHLDKVSSESDRLSALSSSYVALYSELRSQSQSSLSPVPAEFRARAAALFNEGDRGDVHFKAQMVGVPDRYIATPPTDDEMARSLNALLSSEYNSDHSEVLKRNGASFLRVMYPSVASQQSCVDCHNEIQKPDVPWRIGDLMGAYVVENGIQDFINKYRGYSVMLAVLVSILLLSMYVAALFYRDLTIRVAQLNRLACIDPLTGCFNRREFEHRIRDLSDAETANSALLLLDIDNFKLINDTHGHDAGDQILIRFSETVRSQLRATDVLARAGGEEFYVYLTNTSESEAQEIAERIKHAVSLEKHEFTRLKFSITVSIGGLHTSHAPDQSLSLYSRIADNYLYKAKNLGRNRVEWAKG